MTGLPAQPIRIVSAGGQALRHFGRKLVSMRVEEQAVTVCFEVVDLKRPILSVARLLDKGHVVRFDVEPDGAKLFLVRIGGPFVLKAMVMVDLE